MPPWPDAHVHHALRAWCSVILALLGHAAMPPAPPLSSASSSCSRSVGAGARGPVRVVAEKVVGIDLGTTNSAVAAMEGGKPTIVTNAEGQRTTPSVVAYTKAGDRLVGQIAKRQAVVNPENTFFSVKRFIGRKMDEVADESKQVSYNVIRDGNGNVKLDCPAIGKQFAAEEISAQVPHPSPCASMWVRRCAGKGGIEGCLWFVAAFAPRGSGRCWLESLGGRR